MRRLLTAALIASQVMTGGCAAVVTAAATHATAIASAVEIAPLVAAAGAIGAVGVMGAARNGPESFDAGTLGGFLQANRAEAQRLVDIGMRTEQETLVTAGLQVERALGRARLAYFDSLGLKDAALGEPERLFERQVGEIVAALGSGSSATIKEAGDRAQAIAGRLRVPEGAPQVLTTGPVYLFSFLPFQTVSIRGVFPAIYTSGTLPQLTVNGKTYAAYSYSAQGIEFSLPTGALASDDPQAIAWSKAELLVPWERPLFGPLSRGSPEIVVLGLLPDSLGRATVVSKAQGTSADAKVVTETFDLKWGDRRTFAYAPGEWRVRYSIFNRGFKELTGPDLANPFVRVASDERGVTIRTYPF
jgi:hypothetical protein